MPRMPKPQIKKYAEGGDVEEVVVTPEAYEREMIAEKIRRGSKGPPRRNRRRSNKELAEAAIRKMMLNPPYKNMGQALGTFKLEEKKEPEVRMAKGGSIDGCAIRGKTRGKMV